MKIECYFYKSSHFCPSEVLKTTFCLNFFNKINQEKKINYVLPGIFCPQNFLSVSNFLKQGVTFGQKNFGYFFKRFE